MASWLRHEHDVEARHVSDEGLLTADDPVIFAAARDSAIAVVVTKDEDFVRLLERLGPPPQVVWVTIGNIGNAELRRIIRDTWPAVMALLVAGEPLVELGRRVEFESPPSNEAVEKAAVPRGKRERTRADGD